jgi:nucleoside-diphosphate-sugar epimerase
MRLEPSQLILIEHSEFALYAMNEELLAIKERFDLKTVTIHPILQSVRDKGALERSFIDFSPNTIYHAAAYKHVPLVEQNPSEGILNNVYGTKTIAELAVKYGVANFVLISTDKAVRPTNVMGATKRWAELIVQVYAAQAALTNRHQKFCAVRFGNVLGSSGSVVPLFRSQIAKGGPVTLTHPDVTRYFMSIEEAVGLVLQAGSLSEGGEIFLLDMGEPVRIIDLARKMIQLSGYALRDEAHPDGDIEIVVTGLRPGEKLFEELLIDLRSSVPTANPKILKSAEPVVQQAVLQQSMDDLWDHLDLGKFKEAIEKLMELASS